MAAHFEEKKFQLRLLPHPYLPSKLKIVFLLSAQHLPFTMQSMCDLFRELNPLMKYVQYYLDLRGRYITLTDRAWTLIHQQSDDKQNYTIYYQVTELYQTQCMYVCVCVCVCAYLSSN